MAAGECSESKPRCEMRSTVRRGLDRPVQSVHPGFASLPSAQGLRDGTGCWVPIESFRDIVHKHPPSLPRAWDEKHCVAVQGRARLDRVEGQRSMTKDRRRSRDSVPTLRDEYARTATMYPECNGALGWYGLCERYRRGRWHVSFHRQRLCTNVHGTMGNPSSDLLHAGWSHLRHEPDDMPRLAR